MTSSLLEQSSYEQALVWTLMLMRKDGYTLEETNKSLVRSKKVVEQLEDDDRYYEDVELSYLYYNLATFWNNV